MKNHLGMFFISYESGSAQLWESDPDGFRQMTFGPGIHPYSPALSPRGQELIFTRAGALWAMHRHTLEERLIVVGGAARSDLWMQIIADTTGYPVWTIEEDVEAALGAARLAARSVGRAEGGESWVHLTERALPDRSRKRRYDTLFAAYVALYPALKDTMHALAELRDTAA